MLDQAGYEAENQTAFLNLQFAAGARTEVFATTMYNSGKATIRDFVYDSSNIIPGTALPAGALDFPLMSSSFAGFSDVSTSTMAVLMWLGRLEVIPILVLTTRHYWRV